MRVALALLLLPALAWAQEGPEPAEGEQAPKPAKAGDVEIGEPGTVIEDRAVARQEAVRFQKAMKEAKTPAEEIEALERLGKWDHPEILKAASKYLKDNEHTVAIAAAKVVAQQKSQADKAGKELYSALRRERRNHVICALFVGMGVLGYENKGVINEAEKFFKKDTTETHKAATRYFGYIKYKPAFRLLAQKLDEPVPKNPNDPSNPPASYWRERWFEWESNVPYTRWAINQLVEGETFDQEAEAKTWAETHGKEHGIEW